MTTILGILGVIIFLTGSYFGGNAILDYWGENWTYKIVGCLYGILMWVVLGVVAVVIWWIYYGITNIILPNIL